MGIERIGAAEVDYRLVNNRLFRVRASCAPLLLIMFHWHGTVHNPRARAFGNKWWPRKELKV